MSYRIVKRNINFPYCEYGHVGDLIQCKMTNHFWFLYRFPEKTNGASLGAVNQEWASYVAEQSREETLKMTRGCGRA